MIDFRVAWPAAAAFALAACSSGPATISESSPGVRDVNVTGPNINVRIEQEARAFEGSAVKETAMLIQPVVLAIKAGVPGPTNETQRVVFDVRYGKPLREGEPAPDRFGTISIPLAAIKSFEPGGRSVLELAETYDDGSGLSAEAALKSCQEGSVFVADSPHFCSLVMAAAIR